MAPPKLCFLPGAALPLSRPQPTHQQRLTPRRTSLAVARASASPQENARVAQERVSRDVGATPDVAFAGLPLPLRAMAASVTVAAAASAAFAAAPARPPVRSVAAASAAAVTVVAGTVALRNSPAKAARKKLAAALAELGLDSPELPARIAAVQKSLGIPNAQFVDMKLTLYQYYMLAMLSSSTTLFSELSQLTKLKVALALSGAGTGDAHFETCRAFYRENVVFLDADDDPVVKADVQKKLDKLVFLSDRMYADKDTEEAYNYEKSRLTKFFAMSRDEYQQRFDRVALPFYRDVVNRACTDTAVSKEDVMVAQATLGVRDIDAERIRTDAYADRVNTLVSEKGKLEGADDEALGRLRDLLNIEGDRALSTLKTLAEPVFRADVQIALDALQKGEESVASIYGKLALRQTELSYPSDAARDAISNEMTARGIDILRVASKYIRVQNVNACISQIQQMLDYTSGVVALMRSSNDDFPDDEAVIRAYLPNVTAQLSKVEPRQMYRIFLSSCLEDRKVSDEEEKKLAQLRVVLGLSKQEALDAYNIAAGPVYKAATAAAVKAGSFDDAKKAEIVKIREELSLPEPTWKSIVLDLYHEQARKLTEGNRIPQEHESQELFVLREFLGLTSEDAAPVHKDCMGPVYEQSITEAMGPTGIMLDEYKGGLERLRERLGLSKEDADLSFSKVVKQRMLLYVNRAVGQLEKRQAFRGQNEERDVGEDPNIKRAGAFLGIDAGGLPIELSNLVDFYVRNGLTREEEVEVGGEKKTVTRYPVNLRDDVQPQVFNELYKQYVIQCFSAQTRSEKQRLFNALDQLGSILGMTEDEVGKVHSEIGTVIYKNYINQALLKGPLEEKDSEFLTNIQKMLSMTEDHCTKLLKDAKHNRVSVLLEQIFSQPKVLPESVKKIRSIASSLEVDIVKDLSVSAEQRGKLFTVEIDAAIDQGTLTADNQAIIYEVQESLQVSDDAARKILLECIQRRSLSHLVQAAASLRQNRSETAVMEMKTMLRYGKLLPAKVEAPAISPNEKQELYLLFQADVIVDGAVKEKAKEDVNLLKTMLGFSDADIAVAA